MPQSTTLAHLSDIHLPFGLPTGLQWASKQGLSAISWLTRRRHRHVEHIAEMLLVDLISTSPDLIAMGGDLINFGMAREFAASRLWLDRLRSAAPLLCVPGNHEAMAPGWRKNIKEWGVHFAFPEDHAPILQEQGLIGLVGVSTAKATGPFWASGRVGRAHVQAMGELIQQCRKRGLCPIVVMHHPPTRLSSARRGLSDGRAVCDELAKAGAALVLHGHTHHAQLSSIEGESGPIPVLGIPSFSMIKHDKIHSGAWRLLEVTRENSNWEMTMTERTIAENGALKTLTPLRFTVPIN